MNELFVDFVKIFCKSGNGGQGSLYLKKKRYTKKVKKYNDSRIGSGGNGGDIIFQGDSNFYTLVHLKYNNHWIAESGYSGKKNNITGKNGKNLLIKVPLGTVIKDNCNNILAKITKNYQKEIILKGGIGGGKKYNDLDNNKIKTKGIWIYLELKIFSDIGIIGYPNSGKSTLLSMITNAKPRIDSFCFSNKHPYIGILQKDFNHTSIIDIPGIIKNSYEGKGIGINFLKHIEKNRILIFLLLPNGNEKKQYFILLNEIRKFNSTFLKKKKFILISKSEMVSKKKRKKIKKTFSRIGKKILFISSFSKEGILKLKSNLLKN